MGEKRGRKDKLNKALIKEAEKLIKLGNYNTVVCQYLGIHQSTWYKWLQAGEKADSGIKKELFDTIKRAEAHAEIRNVQVIQKAGQSSWTASAWYLERKFPERWGNKEKMQVSGEMGVKIVDNIPRRDNNH